MLLQFSFSPGHGLVCVCVWPSLNSLELPGSKLLLPEAQSRQITRTSRRRVVGQLRLIKFSVNVALRNYLLNIVSCVARGFPPVV